MNLNYETLYGFIHEGLDYLLIEFRQHNLHRDDVRDLIASGIALFELEAEVAAHIDPTEAALHRLILSMDLFYENLPRDECQRLMAKSVQAGRLLHEVFPKGIPSIDEFVSAAHILLRQVQMDLDV